MFYLSGRKFQLAKVGLMRAACPPGLERTRPNLEAGYPVVILANPGQLGRVGGYTPRAIVAAGNRRRQELYGEGVSRSWAFVEAGALEVNADDQMGANELLARLSYLLCQRLFGSQAKPYGGGEWPSIVEVYPFENYFVFQWRGDKYRQLYALDTIERRVMLSGNAQKVEEKYLSAGDARESMPLSQTGARYQFAPPPANLQSFTTGGRTSELVTQTFRNWANIIEAVSMYLGYIKTGGRKPMRPAFAPVAIDPSNHVQKALAANGVDMLDFIGWSAEAQDRKTKRVADEDLPPSAFLHVGDKEDTSTWHLPVHFKDPAKSASHVRDALGRINQTHGIPGSKKAEVLNKLRKLAKNRHGMDISEKPTAKQKKWAASGADSRLSGLGIALEGYSG